MTNEAFRIRIPPSGPDMPAGTPGYFLKIQPNGLDVAPAPVPGGGGSITPLTAALVADENGTATTPTGAWSGDQAFNGASALVDAVAALGPTGGGSVALAPGAYSGNGSALNIQEIACVLRGLGDPASIEPAGVRLFGNITLNASDSSCSLTLETLNCQADISDGGTGCDLTIDRASAAAISITGRLTCDRAGIGGTVTANACSVVDSTAADDFHAVGAVQMRGTTFSKQLFVEGDADIEQCTFPSTTSTALIVGTGTGRLQGNTWSCVTQFGDGVFSIYGDTFKKAVASTSPGTLRMFDCKFDTTGGGFSLASAKLFMNEASELSCLLAGVDVEVTIHALDVAQGGDAVFICSNDTAVDCTAETRAYLGQQVLAANHTYTLNTTGNVGDTQTYTIDTYNRTAHTLTIKDDAAATIATLGTVAAGSGLRYVFGISQTTHKFVLVSIAKITK